MKTFDVSYFKYDKNGGNEVIKSESGINKKRLIKLLETSSFKLDVFHVEDSETGKKYLVSSEDQYILLDDLKHPGVNGIFTPGEI